MDNQTTKIEKKSFLKEIRNIFFTGLLMIIPIFVTFAVISFLFNLIDNSFPLIGGKIQGFGVIATLVVIFLIGLTTRNIFTKQLIQNMEKILSRIPLVKNIYSSTKQIINAITVSSKASAFKKVVLVEYPRKGMYAVGFITKDTSKGIKSAKKEIALDLVSVFLPTSPNPTSGYFVMLAKNDIQYLDMTVEEGFKLIMSAGIVTPET